MDSRPLGAEVNDREAFLRVLASHDTGKIILANLDASLRLQFLEAAACAKFLDTCIAELSTELADQPFEALSAFRDVAKRPEFQFLRQPAPEIGTRVALALRASVLYAEDLRFMSETGRQFLLNSGVQLEQLDRPQDRMELLQQLRSGRVLRSDAALGAPGVLVWATRADSSWDRLVADCERAQRADRVRDHLGLPHSAGQVYFELRTARELASYISQNRRFAAPTTFDAGVHSRFKQESDEDLTDNWNRAIDLDLAFIEGLAVADGAPELVIEQLSFRDVVWHRCIGPTDRDAPGVGDDATFFERLSLSRKEGRRFVEAMIASIVQRLHKTPQGMDEV